MNIKNPFVRLVLGVLIFLVIGSLSSCKTTQAPTYNHVVNPNPHRMNEAEWIKYKHSNEKY